MTCGIYKITNNLNNHCYIGSSVNIEKRWWAHKYVLRKNTHLNRYFQRSWNIHGESAFSYCVLLECSKDILIQKEQEYLDLYFDNQNNSITANAAAKIFCIQVDTLYYRLKQRTNK